MTFITKNNFLNISLTLREILMLTHSCNVANLKFLQAFIFEVTLEKEEVHRQMVFYFTFTTTLLFLFFRKWSKKPIETAMAKSTKKNFCESWRKQAFTKLDCVCCDLHFILFCQMIPFSSCQWLSNFFGWLPPNFFRMTYSGDLNTGLVWYSNGQKLSDPRMVRYSNAIWILD